MPQPKTPDRASIGRSLRAARELRNMTQEDVAFELRSLGSARDSLGSVQRWEKLGSIKLDDAMMLAGIYRMTLDELVRSGGTSGTGEKSTMESVAQILPARPPRRGGPRRR